VPFSQFGQMIGGYGEEVHEAKEIQPALQRAREAIAKTGKCAVVNRIRAGHQGANHVQVTKVSLRDAR
jgi:acetolactate synthase-1/2/3 large subunit